jgi:hypothetical protein
VAAEEEESPQTRHVVGTVQYATDRAVEVAGQRALIGPFTSVVSDGHPISPASIREGMSADLEVDSVGRALELRVSGVVE